MENTQQERTNQIAELPGEPGGAHAVLPVAVATVEARSTAWVNWGMSEEKAQKAASPLGGYIMEKKDYFTSVFNKFLQTQQNFIMDIMVVFHEFYDCGMTQIGPFEKKKPLLC